MIKSNVVGIFRKSITSFSRTQLLSTATQTQSDEKLRSFRTNENDPTKHNYNHIGQYYTVPPKEKKIFQNGGIPKMYETQTKTFNETCFMIRKPAVNLIQTIKQIDYSRPAVRFVLFGQKGCGKSLTLAHVLHFAHKNGFLLVNVPWVGNWMRRCKERSNSDVKEGYIDINLDAAAWLVHFKSQNEHLLKNPDLITTLDYVWSKREETAKGSPLTALIDFGVSRIKYASGCVVALAEEIKELSRKGHCKTVVAIDGFNAFFHPKTRILTEKKEIVHPSKVTITEAFLSLTRTDWNNAAIILTVDELAASPESQESHLPRYLLGKDGFEHLDPFVPILLEAYTDKEFLSTMDYYRDRKWVHPVNGQDEEISFISAKNPYVLMEICGSL